MAEVVISIGSNIDKENSVRRALELLQVNFANVQHSTIYTSKAVGFQGSDFYNLVAKFQSYLDIKSLKIKLLELESMFVVEQNFKSKRSRKIDLDLLLYDDVICFEPGLELPHGDILKYAFVLCPLAEICGESIHPLLNLSYAQLWKNYNKDAINLTAVESLLETC